MRTSGKRRRGRGRGTGKEKGYPLHGYKGLYFILFFTTMRLLQMELMLVSPLHCI